MERKEQKITGLIIAYNEEKNIKEVIECLHFCDEIILVDSFSTDKTLQIAKTFNKVKIIQNEFQDFTKQRNIALENAQNDWVIFLDCDERITPKLETEILQTVENTNAKDAYYFYRKFFFAEKPIHFSGTQNDKNFRLFKKSKCRYVPHKKVHETIEVQGSIGVLKNKLLHYSVADYASYRQKVLLYAKLKSEEYFISGRRYNPFLAYSKSILRFIKIYIFKLGILDGKEGLQLSKLSALSIYSIYKILKNKEKTNG